MKKTILEKYAHVLVHYSLYLKPGEKLFVRTTTLAEPLIKELYREATRAGAIMEVFFDFEDQSKILAELGSDEQLTYSSPFMQYAFENFDAYLNIMAPYNLVGMQQAKPDRVKLMKQASQPYMKVYSERTGNGSMRRSLCLYPTHASAQAAGMSLDDYENFVYGACHLFAEDPASEWLKIRKFQQGIVDHLNTVHTVRYVNPKTDISFVTQGRTWINSDGKANMPSGEVFTSPIEDSVNGYVHFDYPSIYQGHEVQGITLHVENGEVKQWQAVRGGEFLDSIFAEPGARFFGEAAIGCNYGIQTPTKNILFDEKIGGTIHMAIGQSYLQAGGKNESTVHWDMIANMTTSGSIYTDGTLIYENGKFLI
ncbi:aminopeptidase [soil metagenome]